LSRSPIERFADSYQLAVHFDEESNDAANYRSNNKAYDYTNNTSRTRIARDSQTASYSPGHD
jgi:hypothetical protein